MADQEYRDSLFIPSDNRENFKRIIAKRSDLVRFDGGRIKVAGAGTTVLYRAGLVLGYAATGGDAGLYKPYNSANTDGSQTAVAVLAEDALTDEFGNGSEISLIRHGCLYNDYLIGLDSGAVTNLKASQYSEHGVNLIEF